ncbi:MAG: acyltransferase [Sediminibacterium sp.]|nr:acyltransferase [Sediminibacterium sp.]
MFKRIRQKIIIYFLYLFDKCNEFNQQRKYLKYRHKYQISPTFRFNGTNVNFLSDGQIICGDNSYIGENSSIQASPGYKVVIGKGCMISHNVRFYTTSAIPDQDFSIEPLKEKSGDIIIGDYVWIGTNVLINPDITIGDNSVIGANSVVTRNVESNTIVGGVPAKLIRNKIFNAL